MQLDLAFFAFLPSAFQSSPAPKGRCNRVASQVSSPHWMFQSSPAPKGRCNVGNITSLASGSSFNPHRPRKAGATIVCVAIYDIPLFVSILTGPERPVQQDIALVGGRCTIGFNPHRPRKAGATDPATRYGYIYRVSILTGPERPVQQCISLLI